MNGLGISVLKEVDRQMQDILFHSVNNLPAAIILGITTRQALQKECMEISQMQTAGDLVLHRYKGVLVIEDAKHAERIEVIAGSRESVTALSDFFKLLSKGVVM